MGRTPTFLALAGLLLAAILVALFHLRTEPADSSHEPPYAAEGTDEDPLARAAFNFARTHDPATGRIPQDIARRELAFVHGLSERYGARALTASDDWVSRGPHNIGGRTKALGIDVTNEQVILAGGVSSGMFKSTDGGRSWTKTTAPNQIHSVTSLAQNRTPGKEHIWYYGTGDRSPSSITNTAMGLPGTNAFYRGDGLFKSVDGGDSWQPLPSTVSGTADRTDAFDFIWDVLAFGEDGVLVASSAGLFVSSNGGSTWTQSVHFDNVERSPALDLALGTDGVLYAAIDGEGPGRGIFRSADGLNWENMSPPDWPATTVRTVLATAPSNPDVLYAFTELDYLKQQLHRFDTSSGWTDVTGGLPFNAQIATFGGYMMILHVKPDDEDTLFLGAIDLFRSTDGGQTFEVISGTGPNFHVDQTAITFYPTDPRRMIIGNDGGLYRTGDNLAETVNKSLAWESLNNGYLTTQFYTVAIDRGTPGSDFVMGGTQDNGIVAVSSPDPFAPWEGIYGGDGAYMAVADGGDFSVYATAATFKIFRQTGTQRTEITPKGVPLGLWLTILQLDPHDQRVLYVPSQRALWRNSDVTTIPHQQPGGPTDVNWEPLEHVGGFYIHAIGMSEASPRRLYYAGSDVSGQSGEHVFYIDNPHEGQPTPVDITGENFPYYPWVPFVGALAVDPRDARKVMVVFPSYGVLSIFASEDGGASWTPVSGTLEENPDGTGSGPSVRWVSTLYVNDQPVYLAGTSVGLFSATELDGMNTIWTPEAQGSIGNVVIDMLAVRQSDGYVAVATHGNGVYTTSLTRVPTSAGPADVPPTAFGEITVYPNPATTSATVRYRLANGSTVRATVFDVQGRAVETLYEGLQDAGPHALRWTPSAAANGVYFVHLETEEGSAVKTLVLRR